MSDEMNFFGNPERFQVGLSWLPHHEAAEHLPKFHGWSMGALRFTVGGENLMAHRVGENTQREYIWYLAPILHWLVENWIPLFHEEHFPWPEQSADATAAVCHRAIARFATVSDGRSKNLSLVEEWYHRHGLASAASGGLCPDIFIRRFGDDIEVSWTATAPPFAPEGYTIESEPGTARLAVADVASPLWDALCWVKDNVPELAHESYVANYQDLVEKIDALSEVEQEAINAADIGSTLMTRVRAAFRATEREDLLRPEMAEIIPVAVAEAPAVAMFGGISVDLPDSDIMRLRDALIGTTNGVCPNNLIEFCKNSPLRGKPWLDGYELAEDFLDKLEKVNFAVFENEFVDVRAICKHLEVTVQNDDFDTDSIRGVALAGVGFSPLVMVNTRSVYNRNEDGRRFTVAHELCHILHDQSRARRIAHISGSWAEPGVEKRANAFAAWLLMPPRLLRNHINVDQDLDAARIRMLAAKIQVAESALVRHLFNLSYIEEAKQEELLGAISH